MYNLIIADDEPRIREGLLSLYPWEEWGFHLCGAFENGKKVWDYLARCKTDVLLTDVKMPVMDGIELLRKISENHIKIRSVLLSGYNDFEFLRQAIVYGAKDYILKPVKPEQLSATFLRLREELDKECNNYTQPPSEGYYDKIVFSVMKYVQENPRTANLEEAALRVSLSQNYLSTVFKQKTGQNFLEYVIGYKMQVAAQMLQDISLKTYDVAYELGYDNPKNFSRAFKQFYGKTPREFRNGSDEIVPSQRDG